MAQCFDVAPDTAPQDHCAAPELHQCVKLIKAYPIQVGVWRDTMVWRRSVSPSPPQAAAVKEPISEARRDYNRRYTQFHRAIKQIDTPEEVRQRFRKGEKLFSVWMECKGDVLT